MVGQLRQYDRTQLHDFTELLLMTYRTFHIEHFFEDIQLLVAMNVARLWNERYNQGLQARAAAESSLPKVIVSSYT